LPELEITKIQELVYELRVGDVMHKDVVTVAPTTPVSELREILRDNRISGTPVAENGLLIGIISVEDFIRWLAEGGPDCVIADRMTKDVITVCEDEPLIQAINKLERFGFGRLPVVKRGTEKVVGVLTKGDSIAGLVKKLDVDYRQAEKRNTRSSHIFEDIVANRSSLIFEYDVTGGDFERAGISASGLKTSLMRLGISPQTVRRAAIATYEAEMNLIFFTEGGQIIARIESDVIRLEVTDDGPGIENIDQALQPGFSTAPEWVRELGFGAGMGLHNIKTCADRMHIDSSLGVGTRLEVDILSGDGREST
jgi:CBS domain-containing protein/anti-sigma regulatory factor (Ser/Thr protein kinase)